jgi:hypothetical protein|tara:strand:- start:7532 stop:7903 length:372 start_codon:yes stop_codon:yes gene_type:complete
MNKHLAKELKTFAHEVARRFSKPNREGNVSKESFEVYEIIPTSDQTAIVFFNKNTEKLGMGFFYYISKGMSKGWKYFFPTDSHVVGMMAAHYYKLEVERHNYGKNFIDVSNPTPLVDQSKINK